MSNNYTFYDLNKYKLLEGEGILTGEKYSSEVGEYIEEIKEKIRVIELYIKKNRQDMSAIGSDNKKNIETNRERFKNEKKEKQKINPENLKSDFKNFIILNYHNFGDNFKYVSGMLHSFIGENRYSEDWGDSVRYIKTLNVFGDALIEVLIEKQDDKEFLKEIENGVFDRYGSIFYNSLDVFGIHDLYSSLNSNDIGDKLEYISSRILRELIIKIIHLSKEELDYFIKNLKLKDIDKFSSISVNLYDIYSQFENSNNPIPKNLVLIYNELNIIFNEEAHYYFNEVDDEGFYKVKEILKNNSSIKYEILKAFVSISENDVMAKIILAIADSDILEIDKKNIFDKHNSLIKEITDSIDKQGDIIEGLNKEQLYKDAISKINKLFMGIHEIIDDDDLYDYEDDIKEIEELLDNTKQEYIESGIFFKNLKDKNITSLDNLKEVGIDYKKVNSQELNEEEKENILKDFRILYEENYDINTQGVFIDEMIDGIEQSFEENKDIDLYMFYIKGKPVLSSYFKEDNGEKSFGGFNLSGIFEGNGFGFWALEKIFEEQGENHDINALILQNTDNGKNIEENKLKDLLEEKYKELGFIIVGNTKIGSSVYLEIRREKDNNSRLLAS